MKFTLKDYQEDAVDEVLRTLDRARTEWERGNTSSLALTAATGAGKTVMAAAAIEALFYGSDEFGFFADRGAVVLWFSDDPNLNEQTRMRLMDASEKFVSSDLINIESPFAKAKLDPGRVYFLNTQKLSKTSKLTRGHIEDPDQPVLPGTPDLQGYTIWQTIANTISDEDLTLYLILDEAQRGFNRKISAEKSPIVQRLVNGHAGYPPVPIVWGISATIERFQSAMREADASNDRLLLPAISVDPNRVQESGLVKDVVSLDIPNEAGTFESVLVRLAAEKLRSSTERWTAYSEQQGLTQAVVPLLVLQAPNKPDHDEIGRALDTVAEVMPGLHNGSIANVFGEHSLERFGRWEVDYIDPQRVQETPEVRVLVAKDAISTGWDCPRAEVMLSFRPARDITYITQLLGRMVRSPLARRVPGDEVLNTAECILPFFDRTTAGYVVRHLTGQLEEMPGTGGTKKILLDGRALRINESIPEKVWSTWSKLPTQTLPKRGARPVKRLVALAQSLAMDDLHEGALSDAEQHMHLILDTYAKRYCDLLDQQIDDVLRVDIQRITGTNLSDKLTYHEFSMRADDRAIRAAFEDAKKAFGADIAQSYINYLAGDAEDDDSLRDAYVRTSALAMIKEVREKVDQEATQIVDKWFAEYRTAIKSLTDVRQQDYEDIRAMTTDPQRGELGQPRSRMEDYKVLEADTEVDAPLVDRHLMSDSAGMFPMSSLNHWEQAVVQSELNERDAVAWYRNPPRPAVDSIGIAYRDSKGDWRSMHPDFIFFHEVGGEIKASIVDPHGTFLDDAVIKLRALAAFAEAFGDEYHRIDAVAMVGKAMKVLDLKNAVVRESILHENETADGFYRSDVAIEYNA